MDNITEDLEVSIRYKGQTLIRYYMAENYQAPEGAGDIQDMMNVIARSTNAPF